MDRVEFELTDEQLATLMDASKSVPAIMLHIGGGPRTPQENANTAWETLGEELGFEFMTVQPVEGKSTKFFTAIKEKS